MARTIPATGGTRMAADELVYAFPKGLRVRYNGRHPKYAGHTGVVIRPVKSRRVVTLKWDADGDWFDAIGETLEAI